MGFAVCAGATCQCVFGAAPCMLNVLPTNQVLGCNMPVATIMDNTIINLPTFGMCSAPSNPTVISATAAKLGVFTPVPCVPFIVMPWLPGSPTVLIGALPVLNDSSKTMCNWGGMVSIVNPGQMTVMVP